MDKLKMYVGLTALGCVLVMVAGWFLLVSPKRAQVADLNGQAATAMASNAQLQTQLTVLKAKAKDLPKQQARLAAVAAKIPDNPALPALIRALTTAGNAAGVELITVTPGAPSAVTAAAGAAAAPARPGAPAAAAGSLSAIPVTLNVAGGYFQVEQFVANLENLSRSMRITNITMAPGSNPMKPASAGADDGSSLTTTVMGTVFMTGAASVAPAAVAPPAAAGAAPSAGSSTVGKSPTTTSGPGPAVQAPTSSTQESS
jgi:type IV pilus assembly protein PilO